MNPKLQVILDQLRELGLDEQARWLERPESVRELLKLNPQVGYDYVCQQCECDDGRSHLAMCRIAAAWRALGDPRGAEDIERALHEAHSIDRQRSDGPRLTMTEMAVLQANAQLNDADTLARFAREYPQTPEGRLALALAMLPEPI